MVLLIAENFSGIKDVNQRLKYNPCASTTFSVKPFHSDRTLSDLIYFERSSNSTAFLRNCTKMHESLLSEWVNQFIQLGETVWLTEILSFLVTSNTKVFVFDSFDKGHSKYFHYSMKQCEWANSYFLLRSNLYLHPQTLRSRRSEKKPI